ncbi:MAG TPA: twin-arginine translocase TatA/TatE family subunit [Polyangiales bacterium]|jgi:TatA/E family protein of Tat protein translocase|nr:twin-arginine translocase TatA/TatE family subunit [Polyangiales bacterium]
MFGIGPLELAVFLVIVLLVVGPDKLPTFMRTVGKAMRQVRNASREFKDAIGLDELLREGDPFRTPPIRPPRAKPVPLEDQTAVAAALERVNASSPESTEPADAAPPASDGGEPEPGTEADAAAEVKQS